MSELKNANVGMDMTSGPLLGKLAMFSIPIVFSGLLQLLFNAADIAVVGRFTGQGALAAVSASGPVSSLIVTLFMGLSVGANVLCAQYAGAKREKDLSETLHTAVAISAIAGLGLMALGMISKTIDWGWVATPYGATGVDITKQDIYRSITPLINALPNNRYYMVSEFWL